jgi:hypothetical protein
MTSSACGEIGFGAPQLLPGIARARCNRRPLLIGDIRHRHLDSEFDKIKHDGAAQRASPARNDGHSTVEIHSHTSA